MDLVDYECFDLYQCVLVPTKYQPQMRVLTIVIYLLMKYHENMLWKID